MQSEDATIPQALEQAVEYHKAGHLQEAKIIYNKILEIQPNHPDANHNLGVLFVQINKVLQALPLFKTALKTNNGNAQYWVSYIDGLLRAGDQDMAFQVLKQAKKKGLSGDHVDRLEQQLKAKFSVIQAKDRLTPAANLRESGCYDEASEWLEDWISANPNDAEAYALLTHVLLLSKKDEKALEIQNIAFKLSPDLPSVQRNLARIFLKQQQINKALEAASKALQAEPENVENDLVLVSVLVASGQDEKALVLVERVIGQKSDYAEAYFNRALLKLRKNDVKGALLDCDKALSIKPHLDQVWAFSGGLHFQDNNLEKAVHCLDQALALAPDNVNYMIFLGEYKRQDGNIDEALVLLEKAVELAPENENAWTNYGVLLQQADKISDAREAYKRTLTINSRNSEVVNNLGTMEMNDENFKEALELFNKAIQLIPGRIDLIVNKGMALMGLDLLEEAKTLLDDSIRKYGEQTELLQSLALLFSRQEEWQKAKKWSQLAVKSDPLNWRLKNQLASILIETKEYEEAELFLEKAFEKHGEKAGLLRKMARLFSRKKDWQKAEKWARRSVEADPQKWKAIKQLASLPIKNDQDGEVKILLEKALEEHGEKVEVLQGLVNFYVRRKDWETAGKWARRAVNADPDDWQPVNQLVTILMKINAYEEVEEILQNTVERHGEISELLQGLARVMLRQGKLPDAEGYARRAVTVEKNKWQAKHQLAVILVQMDEMDEAETILKKAIEEFGDEVELLQTMTLLLSRKEEWLEAEALAWHTLDVKPGWAEAYKNLGYVLHNQGKSDEALEHVLQALQIKETHGAKNLFITIISSLKFTKISNRIRATITRAISELWGEPAKLVLTSVQILKLQDGISACISRATKAWPKRLSYLELFGVQGTSLLEEDELLLSLLKATPIPEIAMEKFLTMARSILFETIFDEQAAERLGETALAFYSALARQCFICEYVFDLDANDIKQAKVLEERLNRALEVKTEIPALWPVAMACYTPLYSISLADRLLEREWPESVTDVLTQQVLEPKEELQYRKSISRITEIDDEVSKLVKNQYEENPYPRWINVASENKPLEASAYLSHHFPKVSFEPLDRTNLEILIAGCGTGQQPIKTAQTFEHKSLLAIDLSLGSLGYAARKTKELNISSIEYGHADILKLGSIDRQFDIIESVGVLHHLENPLKGWRILLKLLRPGGFMKIGLYSEIARKKVVEARSYIKEQGFKATPEDIRKCRMEIIDENIITGLEDLTNWYDFYSLSMCRDLLFHVCEHRHTLPEIQQFVDANNLLFIGFVFESGEVIRAYKQRFPEDISSNNLENWDIFEHENPNTFKACYQFWIQKKK